MSFNVTNLQAVHDLCNEVHDLVEAVKVEMEQESLRFVQQWPDEFAVGFQVPYPAPSPATGELRRRSMDLTRALARLRSSG